MDTPALWDWLAQHVPAFAKGCTGPLVVEQFGGGYSNLTYLLRGGSGDDAPELVLRRPPRGAPGGVAACRTTGPRWCTTASSSTTWS